MFMNLKSNAIALAVVCAAATVNAQTQQPSPEFEQAALEYARSLDGTKPMDCLTSVQIELKRILFFLSASDSGVLGYTETEATKELYAKSRALSKACHKNQPFKGMTGKEYRQLEESWIPWVVRSGWHLKDGTGVWSVFE